MNLHSYAIIGIAFAVTGCTSMSTVDSVSDVTLTEAAYRHLFVHNSSALKDQATAFCIGGEKDSNSRLVAALSDIEPTVLPGSDCVRGERAVVKETGAEALIFTVDELKCDSVDSCSFRGSYYEANLSSSISHYTARRVEGRWIINLDAKKPQVSS